MTKRDQTLPTDWLEQLSPLAQAALCALDPRHELFVLAYVQHRNAARAAREAGYKAERAKQQGYDLLRQEDVRQAVSLLTSERLASLGLKLERLDTEVSYLAHSRMTDFLQWNEKGDITRVTPSEQLSEAQAAAIRRVKVYYDRSGERVFELELHGKQPALDAGIKRFQGGSGGLEDIMAAIFSDEEAA